MILLLSLFLLLVVIISVLILHRLRKNKREPSIKSSSRKGAALKVTYQMIVEATGAFSSDNLIGSGSFGSVYRGIFHPDETVVAVKVLYLHQPGALKSFVAECEALKDIRHRNLVKILTVCSSIDFQNNEFKALVYEFMANGNLDRWLHPIENREDIISLNLIQRINIAIEVAFALDYLHNHCHKPIVHCDLKPSNVLLDNEMTAHVSDFGLARYVQENGSQANQSSTSFGLKGTIGYAAPEYGTGCKVSIYGDVYSYGILLLEMFTGKRPTDESFNDELNLHKFVEMGLPDRITEILDPTIISIGEEDEADVTELESSNMLKSKIDQIQECLISILGIGVACSVDSPRERMEIGDVVRELRLIKEILRASRKNHSSISGSTRFEGSSSRSATSNWQNVI
jgi:serine/threonine protein kinase